MALMSPEFSKTGPSLVLSKSIGRLQATWNSKAASYSPTGLSVYGSPSLLCSLPYTFRYIFVNACGIWTHSRRTSSSLPYYSRQRFDPYL